MSETPDAPPAETATPPEEPTLSFDGLAKWSERQYEKGRPPSTEEAEAQEDPMLTADEVEVAAKLMDKLLGEAIERKTGVMLSWEDAKGFALTLHAAATSLTLARQAADQVWDATDALCVAGDCNCPVDTCVISLRQEVARLAALRASEPGEEK